jgi:trehalose synthase
LVDPLDTEAISKRMATILDDPGQAQAMGERARERVRSHFLLPELIRRYLVLINYYSGRDSQPPNFRLNDLSYSEVIRTMRPHHPDLGR